MGVRRRQEIATAKCEQKVAGGSPGRRALLPAPRAPGETHTDPLCSGLPSPPETPCVRLCGSCGLTA